MGVSTDIVPTVIAGSKGLGVAASLHVYTDGGLVAVCDRLHRCGRRLDWVVAALDRSGVANSHCPQRRLARLDALARHLGAKWEALARLIADTPALYPDEQAAKAAVLLAACDWVGDAGLVGDLARSLAVDVKRQ